MRRAKFLFLILVTSYLPHLAKATTRGPESCWNETNHRGFADGIFKVVIHPDEMRKGDLIKFVTLVSADFIRAPFPNVQEELGSAVKPHTGEIIEKISPIWFVLLDARNSNWGFANLVNGQIPPDERPAVQKQVNGLIHQVMGLRGVTVSCSFNPPQPSVTGSN